MGCVFFKHVRCDDGTELPGRVGKVFDKTVEAVKEEKAHNMISRVLDPEQLFTVRLYTSCKVGPRSFTREDNPAACTLLRAKRHNRKPHSFTQLIYEHGGLNMQQVLHELQSGSVSLEGVVVGMERVMFALVALSVHGFAHMDVTHRNVLYQDAIQRASLIDFGLMMKASDVYAAKETVYIPYKYIWYPPEFKFAHMLLMHGSDAAHIDFESVLMAYTTNFTSKHVSFEAFKRNNPSCIKDLRQFFEAFRTQLAIGRTRDRSLETSAGIRAHRTRPTPSPSTQKVHAAWAWLRRLAHKVDVYSVGVLWLYVIESARTTQHVHHAGLLRDLRELVQGMACTDGRRRWDALQAYQRYTKLMASNRLQPAMSKHPLIVHGRKLMQLQHLSQNELKARCVEARIGVSGTKQELVGRLIKWTLAHPKM